MDVFARLREFYASIATAIRPLTAKAVDDVPDQLDPQYVYLVGDDGAPWSVAMLCPCKCGAVIQLSLLERDRPRWRVDVLENDTVSLYPSVWRTKDCYSHFVLRRGRIYWAQRGPPRVADLGAPTIRRDVRA